MRTEFLQDSQPDLQCLALALPGLPRRPQSWGRNSLVLPCTHAKNTQEPYRAGRDMLGDLEPNHEHKQLKVQSRKGLAQDPMMEESSQSTNLPGGQQPGPGDTRMNGLALKVVPLSWCLDPCELPSQLLQPQLQRPTFPPSASITPGFTQGPESVTYPVATSVPVLQAVAFPRMPFPAGQSLSTPPTPR